jgi:hypothetical protein
MWYSTEGRPFDTPYLDEMRQWINILMEKDPGIFLFHTENILMDFLKAENINLRFLFPETCSPPSGCTPDNYMRDLEHPSDIFFNKLSDYAEEMIVRHKTQDREGLQRLCRIKDMESWKEFVGRDFSPISLPKATLLGLFEDGRDLCQMVGLENTIFFKEDGLEDIDALFIRNLKESQHFLQLKNNFRTAFRIRPRDSLMPALELFLAYCRNLNERNKGKQYYSVNLQDFEFMYNTCRDNLPEHF